MAELVLYKDNRGGVNFRSNEANINQTPQGTEASLIKNMQVYRLGGYAAQQGNTQLNTSVTDTTAILGIGEYQTASKTYAIYIKASGNAYAMDSAGAADGTAIKTGLSTTAIPQFVQFNGKVIVFNGVDAPWSWDGATAANLSNTPSAWSSTKPISAAVLNGGRIFAIAGSTIYYCALGNENDWTTSSDAGSLTGLFNDNTQLTAIYDYGTALTVHSASPRIVTITGSAPATYAASRIATNRAAKGKLGIVNINDSQYFFSGDGILPVTTTELGIIKLGAQGSEISFKIKPFFTGTEAELPINALDQTKLSSVILLPNYSKNELIAYCKTVGNTNYDTAAIYNFDMNSWVFRQATTVTAAAKVNNLIFTGTSDGKILQEFVGSTIVGTNSFIKEFTTPFLDFGSPELKKRITRVFIWFKTNNSLNITMNVSTDYSLAVVQTRTLTSARNSTAGFYGSGLYGTSTYAISGFSFQQFPLNMVARSFQFDFTSAQSTVDFRVIQYGFEVEPLDDY